MIAPGGESGLDSRTTFNAKMYTLFDMSIHESVCERSQKLQVSELRSTGTSVCRTWGIVMVSSASEVEQGQGVIEARGRVVDPICSIKGE